VTQENMQDLADQLSPKSGGRSTVLVVEDEVLIRMALAAALRERGMTVIEARDADEALQIVHARIAFDAVFTDIRMPGSMDGLRLAALIEAYFPDMPIFISSAYVSRADLRMDVKFMPKPVDPQMAARTIEKAIRPN
jgi:CheY-like chemotaxis protein